jgi:4-amino-4-deoxy-L-arabinose transferase-like glycosyltransferase
VVNPVSVDPGPQRGRRWLLGLAAAAGLLYFLCFHHLGQRDLWSSHEGRAAQHGQRILETGEWIRLRLLDGRDELQKPPLYYWLVAGAGWLRGAIDPWAVRLPAAASALLAIAAVGVWLRQQARPRAALLAMLILATCVRFTWLARVGRIDMPLSAACAWAVVGFLLAVPATGWRRGGWLAVGWFALAAGVLLKGPIGLVLPALVLLVLAAADWLTRDQQRLRVWLRSCLWGLPLALILTLPWFVAMDRATEGRFFHEFFVRHNLQRGLGGDEQLDGHDHPVWFYLLHLAVDALPWSWLLPLLGVALWRRPELRSSETILGLIWFAVVFLFLSLMRYKRPDYLLPAYPGLALALGSFLDSWLTIQPPARVCRVRRGLVGLAAGMGLGWWAYVDLWLPRWEPTRELRSFAQAVREHSPRPTQIILFRVDSHPLVFHLGPSTERLWEWENLDWWACRPAPVYFIMPQSWADQCADHLVQGRLFPVLTMQQVVGGAHELPLVLMTNQPRNSVPQPGSALLP